MARSIREADVIEGFIEVKSFDFGEALTACVLEPFFFVRELLWDVGLSQVSIEKHLAFSNSTRMEEAHPKTIRGDFCVSIFAFSMVGVVHSCDLDQMFICSTRCYTELLMSWRLAVDEFLRNGTVKCPVAFRLENVVRNVDEVAMLEDLLRRNTIGARH